MRKRFFAAGLLMAALLIGGCGLSEENLQLVTDTMENLTKAKTEAETMYGKITDSDNESYLADLEKQYSEYEATNFEKLKDEDVEEMVPKMNDLISSYEELLNEFDTIYKNEQGTAAEEAKYKDVSCYIENKSGSELSGIVLKDVTKGESSENVLFEGTTLPSGRIIAGLTFTLYEDSTSWQLITTDTLGNENTYEVAFTDIDNLSQNGMSLTIYSPDSENGVTVGSYVVVPEPEEAVEEITDTENTEENTDTTEDSAGE
jgi:hypothetical protein